MPKVLERALQLRDLEAITSIVRYLGKIQILIQGSCSSCGFFLVSHLMFLSWLTQTATSTLWTKNIQEQVKLPTSREHAQHVHVVCHVVVIMERMQLHLLLNFTPSISRAHLTDSWNPSRASLPKSPSLLHIHLPKSIVIGQQVLQETFGVRIWNVYFPFSYSFVSLDWYQSTKI